MSFSPLCSNIIKKYFLAKKNNKIFKNCFYRNPTYINSHRVCLGSYGGPVFPYVAFGGFLEEGQDLSMSPDYEKSTAIILSIMIQNHKDKDLLGPALAWEEV